MIIITLTGHKGEEIGFNLNNFTHMTQTYGNDGAVTGTKIYFHQTFVNVKESIEQIRNLIRDGNYTPIGPRYIK